MIEKDIVIITKQTLFDLCQKFLYMGETGQLEYIDMNIVNKELNEVLK